MHFIILSFILLRFTKAETHAEVQEIILGNWFVTSRHLGLNETQNQEKTHYFYLRSFPTEYKTIITATLYQSKEDESSILHNYTLTFSQTSKGKFALSENLNKNKRPVATFDFSPVLPPHISSVGDWGSNKSFNALFITNKIAQLTIFGKEDWTVYTFDKEENYEPETFLDKYYQLIMMGIAFFLAYIVSKKVQSWQIEKKQKEVERILMEQEKQKKKEKKKK